MSKDHRRRENEAIIAKLKGVPAQNGTPETDADPANLNNWVDCDPFKYASTITSDEILRRLYRPDYWPLK